MSLSKKINFIYCVNEFILSKDNLTNVKIDDRKESLSNGKNSGSKFLDCH